MKKDLIIEWRRTGEDTEPALPAVLAEIRMLLEMEGVSVRIVETTIPPGDAAALLFNGVPVEDLLEGVEVIPPSCSSCDSCDAETECRMIRYSGEDYGAIPPDLIGRAAVKALELE